MIFSRDFNILSLQFSIFTPALLFSSNKILGNLMSKFSDIFDGDPTVLPLPKDAPVEIPRLTLPSYDKNIKLEIALSRANMFKYRKEDDIVIDEKSFLKICSDVFREYIDCTSAKVGRLALVVVKSLENPNPGLALARHFCKDELMTEPFNRPESFEIHSHKKYEFSGFKVNSWVRCKSGILQKANVPIILVEQDINTLSEELEKNEFDIDQTLSFIPLAAEEQRKILDKYFKKK